MEVKTLKLKNPILVDKQSDEYEKDSPTDDSSDLNDRRMPHTPLESPPDSKMPHTPSESPPDLKKPPSPSDSPPDSKNSNSTESEKYNPYAKTIGSDDYGENSAVSPPYAIGSPAYAHTPESPPYAIGSPAYVPDTPESPPYAIGSPKYNPNEKTSNSPKYNPNKTLVEKVEKKKRQNKTITDIYSRTLVSKKISVEMKYVGSNIKEILEKKIKELHEGKCIAEGYVKKNTIKIISYSSGKICSTGVLYEVAIECYVCFPVEGQLLNCIATNITKAGIKATSLETPSPFVVFISRDHQLSNKKFNTINEKDHFVARIIGQRFELNDPYISIIAEIDEKKRYIKNI